MSSSDYIGYAPLYHFSCDCESFAITPDVYIQRLVGNDDVELNELTTHERSKLSYDVQYWLVVKDAASKHSLQVRVNDWMLALWVVRPTRLELRFLFKNFPDGRKGFSRLCPIDWNREDVEHGPFTSTELHQAQKVFAVFESITPESRLGMALSLTYEAISQHRWHAGIVLYSAAVETLLTNDRKERVTLQLAKAYSALVAPGAADRSKAEKALRAAYVVRSDIVHGRNQLEEKNNERLRALALWAAITRDIWQVVVVEPAALQALQDTDPVRKAFLDKR
ncbi:HEPN domain-containing protein [Tahibacter soli]|uniref:HEPN domain-containing protein n=1 Tax=Tahibacter soli TaxID=2983605 RepID=A0A9X3YL14_9GAMM|nr:HEPN domain-containing protein [Tahibacter soli]MDC8012946.1 HEPN domain-containing protein [Tahibacter soli]